MGGRHDSGVGAEFLRAREAFDSVDLGRQHGPQSWPDSGQAQELFVTGLEFKLGRDPLLLGAHLLGDEIVQGKGFA
jgi:hypothetical protein